MFKQIDYILKDAMIAYKYNTSIKPFFTVLGIIWVGASMIVMFSPDSSDIDWGISFIFFIMGFLITLWNFCVFLKYPGIGDGEKTGFRKLKDKHYIHVDNVFQDYRIREVMVGDNIKYVVEGARTVKVISKNVDVQSNYPTGLKEVKWVSVQPISARTNKPYHNIYSRFLETYAYAEYIYLWYTTATQHGGKEVMSSRVDDWSDF